MIRRRKWWLLGSILVGLLGSLAYCYTAPKEYTATASVLVEAADATSLSPVAPQSTIGYSQVQTDVELVSSAPVKSAVRAKLGWTPKVVASGSATSDLIDISSTNTNPRHAELAVNAYADALVNHQRTAARQEATAAAMSIQAQISTVQKSISGYQSQLAAMSSTTSPQAQAIEAQITALESQLSTFDGEVAQAEIQASLATGGVTVGALASVPKVPSSPKKVEDVALAVFGFAVLGLALMLIREAVDDRVRSADEMEALLPGAPTLGVIPRVEKWRSANEAYLISLAIPTSPAAEAYRSLRTAIEFAKIDRSLRSLVVSSAQAGEGKTTTAANLGVAFARSGSRVLVVSADLRRPRLGSFYKTTEQRGLASVALGHATLEEAVVAEDEVPGLWFLGTGPLPGGPAEFLASPKVAHLFEELSERYDLVIVDTPPLLPVADAFVVSRYVDAVLLVASESKTSRRALVRVGQLCEQSGVDLLGVVFNDVSSRTGDYAIAYSYPSAEPAAASRDRGRGRHSSGSRPRSAVQTLHDVPRTGS